MQPSPPTPPDEPPYETFYGLREQPFSLTTDPRFLYLSAGHRLAFDELLTGLRRREGLLLLTGDTGTGKTTLCRAVIDALGHRAFSALILNPYMSDIEVLRTIVRDFGLVTRDEIRTGAFERADVPQLMDTLEQFLRSLIALKSYAVVIIDEAQSLSPRVLDQIRVLGSLEFDGKRLLQIMLAGQPALVETLRGDGLRALADRISRRVALGPLPAVDVPAYIHHRLAIAGGKGHVTFGPDAIQRVTDLSDGLPRRINLLCDRSLEIGRAANSSVIDAAMVSRAAKAIAGATAPEPSASPAPAVAVVPVAPSTPAGFTDISVIELPAVDAPNTRDAARETEREAPPPAAVWHDDRDGLSIPDFPFDPAPDAALARQADPDDFLDRLDETTLPAVGDGEMFHAVEAPKKSGLWFWLGVLGGAAAAAAALYYYLRHGGLR